MRLMPESSTQRILSWLAIHPFYFDETITQLVLLQQALILVKDIHIVSTQFPFHGLG